MLSAMSFSASSIIAGFIFGVFGFAVLKHGKKNANNHLVVIGIAMVAYPYFVANPWLNWFIGLALTYASYFYWNY